MFGYIVLNKALAGDGMKKCYQGVYCGLCRELKCSGGMRERLLLNYDMTFMILLLSGLYEPQEERERFRCALHPFRERVAVQSPVTEYAACMNVLLAYHKLLDDWKDRHQPVKRAYARLLSRDYQRVCGEYPRQQRAVEEYIRELSAIELAGGADIDPPARITGQMLGELFAWHTDEWYDELKRLGLHMGRFIYLMDAYDDLYEDQRSGSYNPLLRWKERCGADVEDFVRLLLTEEMAECARTFERLPILRHADILRNILYSGVWTRYEYLQHKNSRRAAGNGKGQGETE